MATHAADTERELHRITSEHDRDGNVLIISAGAPSTTGLCIIAEEIAVEPTLLANIDLP
jgi:hypothetical protein